MFPLHSPAYMSARASQVSVRRLGSVRSREPSVVLDDENVLIDYVASPPTNVRRLQRGGGGSPPPRRIRDQSASPPLAGRRIRSRKHQPDDSEGVLPAARAPNP